MATTLVDRPYGSGHPIDKTKTEAHLFKRGKVSERRADYEARKADYLAQRMKLLRVTQEHFKSVFQPQAQNDPLERFRDEVIECYGYNQPSDFVYLGKPLDGPCLELPLVPKQHLIDQVLKKFPHAVFLNLSGSTIAAVNDGVFLCPLHTLILNRCEPKLVSFFVQSVLQRSNPETSVKRKQYNSAVGFDGGKTVEFFFVNTPDLVRKANRLKPQNCPMQLSLNYLDVSNVDIGDAVAIRITEAFKLLNHLLMNNCGLSTFPVELCSCQALKSLDLSHNNICDVPTEFFRLMSNSQEEGDEAKTGKVISLRDGLSQNLVREVKDGIFLGVKQDDAGTALHVDLRENPLSAGVHDVLQTASRVKISDKHQVACFSGNLFVYTNLPKAKEGVVFV